VSVDLQNDHVNTRAPFTRANGTIQSFYGNRQQGTVTGDMMLGSGPFSGTSQEVLASLYALENNVGGGAEYRLWDGMGSTSIQVDYNRPDTDYVEMTVQHGTKHDIHLERKQIITEDLTAKLGGGFSHYSMDNDWSAAEAPGWNFDLDYNHPVNVVQLFGGSSSSSADEITFGAHYAVEAEYFTSVDRRTDSTGQPFNPLPATNYEVHSFTGSASKAIFAGLNAEAFGGYAVNRLQGNSGPLYGGSLNYSPIEHLGFNIHGSRTLLGGQNNGEKEEIVGADVKWTW
jgi:hypothetical protein